MPTGMAEATIKAAMNLAAGKVMTAGMVPASIAQLVKGEIRTMIFTKLTMIAAGVVAIGFVTTGVGLLAAGGRADPPAQRAAAPAQADDG